MKAKTMAEFLSSILVLFGAVYFLILFTAVFAPEALAEECPGVEIAEGCLFPPPEAWNFTPVDCSPNSPNLDPGTGLFEALQDEYRSKLGASAVKAITYNVCLRELREKIPSFPAYDYKHVYSVINSYPFIDRCLYGADGAWPSVLAAKAYDSYLAAEVNACLNTKAAYGLE